MLLAAGVLALVAGAYMVGRQQGGTVNPNSGNPATVAAVEVASPPKSPAPAPATAPAETKSPAPLRSGGLSEPLAGRDARQLLQTAPSAAAGGAKGRFTHFRVGNRNVKAMHASGNQVWVGTSSGVIRYEVDKDDYKLFDVRNGSLVANGVFHVGKLGEKISVGTYGGGLSLYDPATEKWETFNIPQGLADAFVYGVLQAKNGDVWIATWSGANRIVGGNLKDRASWRTYTVENTQGGLPNDWVYGLAEGLNGDIWMATEGGVALFREEKWQHWTHKDGVGAPYDKVKSQNEFDSDPGQVSSHHARQKQEQGLSEVTTAYNPNYIISLAVDAKGGVWCGTWGAGLSHFDGKSWINQTRDDGLPANHVFMLHLDDRQRLWVGTSGGLALRDDAGKFSVKTTADGLFSNNVFSMAFSADGSQWVGSYGGVARIFPEKTDQKP
ncbi:MAG: regulator [Magnetococcales bacterium]|nr:regulator [Magnetococcales bacterium]